MPRTPLTAIIPPLSTTICTAAAASLIIPTTRAKACNTAEQPYIKVIGLPVLCKYVLEHGEQKPCDNDGQNRFLKKVFQDFPACHNITPFPLGIAG